MGKKGVAVVAVGGNSLIKDETHKTIPDQFDAAIESMHHIVDMIQAGWEVVVTHGNGPQVGFILRRSELSLHELHPVPLDYCGADTQGAIGYMFVQALHNEFLARGMSKPAAAVVTQTIVDRNDKAFQNPTKPIGSFMSEATAKEHAARDHWTVVEDAGRGWRRVVASPIPQRIVEADAIRKLIDAGFVVVDNMDEAFKDADIIYAKSWGAMVHTTDEKAGAEIISRYSDWITDERRMGLAKEDAIYMHPLPADRNIEVTDGVIDSPQSVVYDEAENRMHVQKAVMALTMS